MGVGFAAFVPIVVFFFAVVLDRTDREDERQQRED